MSFPSPMWIFNLPPCTWVATGAGFTSSTIASSSTASSFVSTIASITSAVIGVKESQVLVNFAPNIWPIVKQPSNFKRPESTNSSNIAGSSKLAGPITNP